MYIRMPNKYKLFLDNGLSNYKDRLQKIEETILDYNNNQWTDYFNDGWLRDAYATKSTTVNHSKDILERCATYLLMGQYQESNVLTNYKKKQISEREIPVSSTSSNANDLIYSGNVNQEDGPSSNCSSVLIADTQISKDIYNMSDKEIGQQKKKSRKSKKKWKQTRTYKMNRFYSTPSIKTYRVKPVKGPNGKNLKDISGNIVLHAIDVTIGGHKGILEPTTKFSHVPSYVAKWCTVDIYGYFTFMNKEYCVTDKRYEVENTPRIVDSGGLNEFTNKAAMEKILCIYKSDEELLFYDELISPVDINTIGVVL